jgi:uncharacterized protein
MVKLSSNKVLAGMMMMLAVLSTSTLANHVTFNYSEKGAFAQPFVQTVNHRDLMIDLGNGIQTNAQLTIPAVGNGPFPGVLLVHGSGPVDMNETVAPGVEPFWQISQFLSERGFAVLRYDKRGVGPVGPTNYTILDANVWSNATFHDLKNDAARALNVLIEQPEVDPSKITLIGHSEGAIIVPRVVMDLNNSSSSNNNNDNFNSSNRYLTQVPDIVLMSAVAQNLITDLSRFQVVENLLMHARQVLDKNNTGLISIQRPIELPLLALVVGMFFDNSTVEYIDIDRELKPVLEEFYENFTTGDTGNKCSDINCPIWMRSHAELEPTLNVIGNVSESTSILIMNGENDSQTPVQQAFLLEQSLTEVNHPDHTLITYPDLGHVFSPSSPWFTEVGPIEEYVLADLHRWLSDRAHGLPSFSDGN